MCTSGNFTVQILCSEIIMYCFIDTVFNKNTESFLKDDIISTIQKWLTRKGENVKKKEKDEKTSDANATEKTADSHSLRKDGDKG